MMRRLALASMAIAVFAAPAAAQWYPGWDRYGDRPYYGQQPSYGGPYDRGQSFWGQPRREPYYDDGGDDRYQPEPDNGWQDQRGASEPYYYPRGNDNRTYDQRPAQQQQRGGYGVVRSGGPRPYIAPRAPQRIAFRSSFPLRSIVIDTEGRKLYFILSPYDAYQYPISVGREGFSWTGTEVISREQEWPDWYPPKEMMARDPRVPEKMTGGIDNPLGALALYLGKTLYRIHGTNDPNSLGRAASSGCFRMMNEHVLHLASLAPIGTQVTVVRRLPGTYQPAASVPPSRYDGYPPQTYSRSVPQRY